MAGRDATFPQHLRPHPRGVRGEAEGTDRGDEGRDCGSKTAEEFGRGRWATAGGEERQAGKKEGIKRNTTMRAETSVHMAVF